jgi:phage-related protein
MAEIFPLPEKITKNSRRNRTDTNAVSKYAEGYVESKPDGINSIRYTWTLVVAPLTQSDLSEIDNFHGIVKTNQYWTWTDPITATLGKWRIVKNTWQQTQLKSGLFSITFQAEQVFDNA